jgi:hypothetical protein
VPTPSFFKELARRDIAFQLRVGDLAPIVRRLALPVVATCLASLTCRSTQLKRAFSLPPRNHFAYGLPLVQLVVRQNM